MKSLGLGDVEDFPFLDPPQPTADHRGLPRARGARRASTTSASSRRSGSASRASRSTRASARMILAGAEHGCLREVLVVAAALNIQDPRERPRELAAEGRRAPPALPRRALRLRRAPAAVGRSCARPRARARPTCGACARRTSSRSCGCASGARSTASSRTIVRELAPRPAQGPRAPPARGGPALAPRAPHRAPVPKSASGTRSSAYYTGAKQTRFAIHPSSALAQEAARVGRWRSSWSRRRSSSRARSRRSTRVARRRRRRTCSSAATPIRTGRRSPRAPIVKEHATLFGLPVLKDRSVDYASVAPGPGAADVPRARARARRVPAARGRSRRRTASCSSRGRAAARQGAAERHARRRRRAARVLRPARPGRRRRTARPSRPGASRPRRQDPDVLVLSLEDVLAQRAGASSPTHYPDALTLHGASVPVTYGFDPSADDDGITLTVPLALLAAARSRRARLDDPRLAPGEDHGPAREPAQSAPARPRPERGARRAHRARAVPS